MTINFSVKYRAEQLNRQPNCLFELFPDLMVQTTKIGWHRTEQITPKTGIAHAMYAYKLSRSIE